MKNTIFKRVALIGRRRATEIPETITALAQHLLFRGCEVILEQHTAEFLPDLKLSSLASDQLKGKVDLMVVIGGDGSLINAAHIAIHQDLPVVGVNRGSLGFLTDIHPDELHKFDDILQGKYQQEERSLLQVVLEHEGNIIKERLALNDVVLFSGELPRMIYFDVLINQQFVCGLHADGLIVSTPTGSTAYSLSAGGPILHPHLEAILLVPMFPHRLTNRPFVVDDNSVIEIIISENNEDGVYVSCDGQERIELSKGACIKITQHAQSIRLIHPQDYHYFTTLREKLGWQD